MLCHKLLDIKQFMVLVHLLYAPNYYFLEYKTASICCGK